ncbi:MAG: endonuclease V [Methanomassiliicoccales archaeon]|jgi:deoxyribonuclease V
MSRYRPGEERRSSTSGGKRTGSTSESCGDDVDLIERILSAVREIPEGRVSTYGEVAKALGDVRAARAVGAILATYASPVSVPCHRVVYGDGCVGWYGGSGKGSNRKVEVLEGEGIQVEKGIIANFDTRLFREFDVEPVLKMLADEQSRWRSEVIDSDDFGKLTKVAGLDVAYDGDIGYAAMVVVDADSERVLENKTCTCKSRFPYVPSYLGFRETPMVRPLIKDKKDIVYLVDGHGVLHPRGFGVACQIGVRLDIATVGAAKSLLEGKVVRLTAERDKVEIDGQLKGYAIGRKGKRTTYVSVGHRVSLETATEICERMMHYSVPEPLRLAHVLANEEKRKAMNKEGGS